MVDTGLTFEEQQMQARHFINKLGISLKELNKKELEEEIARFLKRLQCLSLGTVNPDGSPHQTILDYVSDGLTIYIASAGGTKFINLDRSNKVSVSIGFTDGTTQKSVSAASRNQRSFSEASEPWSSILSATSRSRSTCRALHTIPIPPRPSSASRR